MYVYMYIVTCAYMKNWSGNYKNHRKLREQWPRASRPRFLLFLAFTGYEILKNLCNLPGYQFLPNENHLTHVMIIAAIIPRASALYSAVCSIQRKERKLQLPVGRRALGVGDDVELPQTASAKQK